MTEPIEKAAQGQVCEPGAKVLEAQPQDLRRLLPLDLWTFEKARALRAWGIHSEDLPRLLRRHEQKFTAAGVVQRHGNAWRLIEPFGARRDEPAPSGFLRELVLHVQEERQPKAEKKTRGKATNATKSDA